MDRLRWAVNRFWEKQIPSQIEPEEIARIREFHRTLPGYEPTPLHRLSALAGDLGVGEIWSKDESQRFGLKAFKVLGASYGLARFLEQRKRITKDEETLTFTTATDGNHGRAVAWAASRLGHKSVIYVPEDMVPARREAIGNEGAQVMVVAGNYDDAVAEAERQAAAQGRQVLSDTAYPGYEKVPEWITRGYSTLFDEIREQLQNLSAPPLTHVFLQGGVGGMASTGVRILGRLSVRPSFICVEPMEADCLLASIRSERGEPQSSQGSIHSIMSGLNCAFPSLQAWPILRAAVDLFLAVDDPYAEEAVRHLYHSSGQDPRITAGETGGAGLAGLLALLREPSAAGLRDRMRLNEDSQVLLIVTEGDTDPVGFRRIVERS